MDYMVIDDVEDGKEREVGNDQMNDSLQAFMKGQMQQAWPASGFVQAARPLPMPMLDRLKHFHVVNTVAAVESLVELAAYGRSLKAEYKALGIPEPKWLTDNLRAVQARAKEAYKALQEEKIRRLEMEIEGLRSKEEKKAAKEQELAELRAALGITE